MLAHFNWTDYAIIAVIVLSVVVSFVRGFIRESVSLVVWISAVLISFRLAKTLSVALIFIKTPSLRLLIAFFILFVAVLIAGAVITFLLRSIIQKMGLSEMDRLLGGLFGMLRGVLLISILVLLASFTLLTRDVWWTHSKLLPYFLGLQSENQIVEYRE